MVRDRRWPLRVRPERECMHGRRKRRPPPPNSSPSHTPSHVPTYLVPPPSIPRRQERLRRRHGRLRRRRRRRRHRRRRPPVQQRPPLKRPFRVGLVGAAAEPLAVGAGVACRDEERGLRRPRVGEGLAGALCVIAFVRLCVCVECWLVGWGAGAGEGGGRRSQRWVGLAGLFRDVVSHAPWQQHTTHNNTQPPSLRAVGTQRTMIQ